MHKDVKKAKNSIRLIMIYYIVLTVLGDILSFRFGIGYAIFCIVASSIPLIAMLTQLDSIYQGNRKALNGIALLICISILGYAFSLLNSKQDISKFIIPGLLTISYLIQLAYLYLSKSMKKLFTYTDKINTLNWLWSWGGKCVGYKDGDYLWGYDGHNIGKFYGMEVYSPDSCYLFEQYSNGRLVIDKSKKNKTNEQYTPLNTREAIDKKDDISGFVLYANFEDLPNL